MLPTGMTREEAIAVVRVGLSLLPHDDARTAAVNGFKQLVAELDQAEKLLDEAYDDLTVALPRRKRALDFIVFSRRLAARAEPLLRGSVWPSKRDQERDALS